MTRSNTVEPTAEAQAPRGADENREMWNLLAEEHANRRWALASCVGYLKGAINSAISALDAGADGEVVARMLREMLEGAPR